MAANLLQALSSFDPSQCSSEVERLQLVEATYALHAKLQNHTERMIFAIGGVPLLNATFRTLLQAGLFKKWEASGGGPKTTKELAGLAGIDEALLRRLLLNLVAHHFLDQIDKETFAIPKGAIDDGTDNWVNFYYDLVHPLVGGMPDFLHQNGYKEPHDLYNGIIAHAKNAPGHGLFEFLAENPEYGTNFNACMTQWGKYRTHWLDIYPSESLIDNSDNPIIVDIAGGIGHDLEKFNKKHPGHANRLVLVDQPAVLAQAICDKDIKTVAHNFFEPQPVKGARAYYLKEIIHDWPDDKAIQILKNIKPAMTPGYSRILVNDVVMPPTNPSPRETMLDLLMMGFLASLERSEEQWNKIISAAGLKLVKIYSDPTALEKLIEIELGTD